MESFDILTGDQELEVHMGTYGPEIDQSHGPSGGTSELVWLK